MFDFSANSSPSSSNHMVRNWDEKVWLVFTLVDGKCGVFQVFLEVLAPRILGDIFRELV